MLYYHFLAYILYYHFWAYMLYNHFWAYMLYYHFLAYMLYYHYGAYMLYYHFWAYMLYYHFWAYMLYYHFLGLHVVLPFSGLTCCITIFLAYMLYYHFLGLHVVLPVYGLTRGITPFWSYPWHYQFQVLPIVSSVPGLTLVSPLPGLTCGVPGVMRWGLPDICPSRLPWDMLWLLGLVIPVGRLWRCKTGPAVARFFFSSSLSSFRAMDNSSGWRIPAYKQTKTSLHICYIIISSQFSQGNAPYVL